MLFYYHYNLIHFYRLKKALPRHGNIPAMSMNYPSLLSSEIPPQANHPSLYIILPLFISAFPYSATIFSTNAHFS